MRVRALRACGVRDRRFDQCGIGKGVAIDAVAEGIGVLHLRRFAVGVGRKAQAAALIVLRVRFNERAAGIGLHRRAAHSQPASHRGRIAADGRCRIGPTHWRYAVCQQRVGRFVVFELRFGNNRIGGIIELGQKLQPILLALSQLQEVVDNTAAVVNSEAYASALTVYGYAKSAGKAAALQDTLDDLGKHFSRKPASSASKAPLPKPSSN